MTRVGEWGHCNCNIASCCPHNEGRQEFFEYFDYRINDEDDDYEESFEYSDKVGKNYDDECVADGFECWKSIGSGRGHGNSLLATPSECARAAEDEDYPHGQDPFNPVAQYYDYPGDINENPILYGQNASINQFPFATITTARYGLNHPLMGIHVVK